MNDALKKSLLPENYLEESEKANSIEIARMNIKLCRENQKLIETMRWIAKGPTYGPGAPTLAEQAVMQSDRAKEVFKELGIKI